MVKTDVFSNIHINQSRLSVIASGLIISILLENFP